MSILAREWARIEAWAAANAQSEFIVAPPVAPERLAGLAAALGRPLPAELAEWLSMHDGARLKIWTKNPQLPWKLLGAEQVEDDWAMLRKIHAAMAAQYGPDTLVVPAAGPGPVSGVYWKPAWIPFATDQAGDHLCFDMEPEPSGSVGQVLFYRRDPARPKVIATSLAALLGEYADGLERGEYEVEPYVGIVPRSASSE